MVRRVAAYLVCLAFGMTFLLSTLMGAQGDTALIRGVVVAGITLVVSRFLIKPVVDVVLDAIARDRAAAEEER